MAATPSDKRIAARFDGFMLLREPLELVRDGQRVRLQEMPLRILEFLVSRPAELVTREELVARLWPKGVVEFDAGLNTAMRKLRAALGDDADAPRLIETVPRQGYRFIGKLETPFAAAAASAEPARAGAPAVSSAPPSARRRLAKAPAAPVVGHGSPAAALLSSALISIAAAFIWRIEPPPRDAAPTPATSQRYRIAVLPFENLSPDPANAFFADGMHEEVLSTLTSRAANLDVISRATMMSYRVTPKPVAEIARDLGVTHVLEGTVRRDGEQVRITVKLIDAAADNQLWAQSFDSALGSAMTLQSEVAAEVAEQLAVKLSANPLRLPPSRNLEAYDLWLKGTLAWQIVGAGATLEEVQRVEAMFSRALDLDQSYAAAYADRARVRMAKFDGGVDPSAANVEDARADLATARKLAGDAPHVLIREATLAMLDRPRHGQSRSRSSRKRRPQARSPAISS